MPQQETTQLKHIIYSSRPVGFEEKTVEQILSSSRKNNPSVEVTGLLIYRADLYLQLLEGPTNAVEKTFNILRVIEYPNKWLTFWSRWIQFCR